MDYTPLLEESKTEELPLPTHTWFVRQMAQHPAGESNHQHTHLAIDGKALKSTGKQAYGGDWPQQHLLHVLALFFVPLMILLLNSPVQLDEEI